MVLHQAIDQPAALSIRVDLWIDPTESHRGAVQVPTAFEAGPAVVEQW